MYAFCNIFSKSTSLSSWIFKTFNLTNFQFCKVKFAKKIDPLIPKDMFRLVFLSSVFLLQARGVALRQNRVWEGGGELYSLPVIIRFFWSACTFASTSRPDKTEVATRDVLCMYVCVCMCVCMYVCIYIYICRHVLIYITRRQAGRRAMRIIDIMVGESCVSLTSIFPDCSLDHTHHLRALRTIRVRGRSSGSPNVPAYQMYFECVSNHRDLSDVQNSSQCRIRTVEDFGNKMRGSIIFTNQGEINKKREEKHYCSTTASTFWEYWESTT